MHYRMTNRFNTVKREAIASRGMVTSNHRLGSVAGTETLAIGGNAIDAAISTMFALSVVEPMMTTIFGAGFINILHSTGEVTQIDNYANAPFEAKNDMFTPIPGSLENEVEGGLNSTGYLAVATGGSLLGWASAVDRYGNLPLHRVVEPAVRYARHGFPVSPYLRAMIVQCEHKLAHFPSSAAIFLPQGRPPAVGDIIQRIDYANTLEQIGLNGPDHLYHGPLGETLVEDMRRNGGIITDEDLKRYRIFEREPIRSTYRGYEVVSMAPACVGGTQVSQTLNILEGFNLRDMGFGSPETIHVMAEAMKISFGDRFKYMADPERTPIPLEWLLSKTYADDRRSQIDLGRAQKFESRVSASGEGDCTTHCCAADADGNLVTTTQTLNNAFGSGVTVPGTGMLLNNCMILMDPNPGEINSIEPGKRIISSNAPTLVLSNNRPYLAIGTPGGMRIFAAVTQAIVNLVDHGMTLQQAVEAPRMWSRDHVLEMEQGFANLDSMTERLAGMQHNIETPLKVAGGMNGILFDHASGMYEGAACWRADGTPIGISGGDAIVDDTAFEAGIPS